MTTTEHVEPWVVEQRWDLTYRHAADPAAGTFFRTLRDEGRLLGTRCPQCERVLFPPRSFCDRDFCDTEGWVEVGTEGEIELFTIVHHRIAGLPEPPYAIAYVRPDGADTAVVNFVEGVDLGDLDEALARLRIGARAQIRLRERREGRMTEFWFEVLDS
jgi:uncharacterized protein